MTKPDALALADQIDAEAVSGRVSNHNGRQAAAELRRLHAETTNQKDWLVECRKWEAWTAAPRADGVGVAAPAAPATLTDAELDALMPDPDSWGYTHSKEQVRQAMRAAIDAAMKEANHG